VGMAVCSRPSGVAGLLSEADSLGPKVGVPLRRRLLAGLVGGGSGGWRDGRAATQLASPPASWPEPIPARPARPRS
jgi:hypothetical protein